ncbi:DNA repair REX1-B-domain-containing protein [Zychaea mexicana]|uniref:DNA repair REX1-B-domain-containing protein n=1 Tax=Zychaea mexicana TaxID=64656 RepID=UPI0022FE77F0|nr:DNA repair REX1-B-domain-containing protein [Zychaea mexicana]KAI9488311.1 DNA repair REX1-B-domain-containing protein [Zychaea mexicana]
MVSAIDKEAHLLSSLQSLIKAQSTRMGLYKEFNDAFQDYLDDKCPEEQYYSVCRLVTEGFQEVSTEIQSIEQDMNDECNRKDLGSMIRQLQEKERAKLHETVHLQIYTIKARKGDKDYDATLQEHNARLNEIAKDISEIWDEIRQESAELSYTLSA